jgi:hypothetical protein
LGEEAGIMPVAPGSGSDATGGVSAPLEVELTVTANGQTAFTLPTAVAVGGNIRVYVNGVRYDLGDDFTVSGTTLTWVGSLSLLTSDEFRVVYYSV